MIGQNVRHYKVGEKLGEGGMGVVYKAEDNRLKRIVALKFLQPNFFADPDGRTRFIHEAQAAAALDHPNICTVYEIDEAEDRAFISMAYIEGQSLRQRIESRPFSLQEVLDIAIQMADGLQAAHDKGIVHRDVKSANIMVTPSDQVKIMDFGLAKFAGQSKVTRTGMTLGTVDYMSPEQACGDNVDHRTDIWSLGVVLYEVVSGKLPFRGEVDQAVVYAIVHEPAPPLSGLIADVPTELERIIAKTLVKNVEDRYQSAADVATDLRALSANLALASETHAVKQFSIAVLPFTNMSADTEQEYFCDGMAEDIINDLTNVEGLRVVSRTSSFAFKGHNEDVREIGKKLRVKTLLEGSVRKSGGHIRITAQLINVADGYHIWSQRYDRELKDVFAIQDEISKNIVHALKVKLTDKAKQALEKTATKDVAAYDLYLRGRELFYEWQHASLEEAIALFSQAIDRDSNYSLAYAGMADCWCVLFTDCGRKREHLERALDVSKRALELDPELAEAHAAYGYVITCLTRDYGNATQEFETAIRLNGKLFQAYYFYARCCFAQGKLEKAAQLLEQACLVKPDDYQARCLLAQTYRSLGLEAGAEAAYQRALERVESHVERHPEDPRAYQLGAHALLELGEREKGLEWARKAASLDPTNPALLYNMACTFCLVGGIEDAIGYLRRAVDGISGDADMKEWAMADPYLKALRDDPRFTEILQRFH